MTRDFTNAEDILDTRDLIARIDELTAERDDVSNVLADPAEGTDAAAATAAWDATDEGQELATLKTFAAEIEGYCPDFQYGETLIRDSYFEDYARELAEDIGAFKNDATWPNTCIDWKQAARELQMDYTSAEFAGVTYWFR